MSSLSPQEINQFLAAQIRAELLGPGFSVMTRELGGEFQTAHDSLGRPVPFSFLEISSGHQTFRVGQVCKDVDLSVTAGFNEGIGVVPIPSVQEVISVYRKTYPVIEHEPPFIIPIAQTGFYYWCSPRRHYVVGILKGPELFLLDSFSSIWGYCYNNPITSMRQTQAELPYEHVYQQHCFYYENQLDYVNCGRFVSALILGLVRGDYCIANLSPAGILPLIQSLREKLTALYAVQVYEGAGKTVLDGATVVVEDDKQSSFVVGPFQQGHSAASEASLGQASLADCSQ